MAGTSLLKLQSKIAQIATGVSTAAVATLLRMPLDPILSDRAPWLFVSGAVIASSVLGGWLAGMTATLVGQAMVVYFLIDPGLQLKTIDPSRLYALGFATIVQLSCVAAIAWYEARVKTATQNLNAALKEIEHRTKNNYQIILSLLTLQSRTAPHDIQAALQQLEGRILALSLVTEALRGKDLDRVDLHQQINSLTYHLKEGLCPHTIHIHTNVESIEVDIQKAVPISLIINEVITNSLKYAFPKGHGNITVTGERTGSGYVIHVRDDGHGMDLSKKSSGLGSKLIARFVKQLGATSELHSDSSGTYYKISIYKV